MSESVKSFEVVNQVYKRFDNIVNFVESHLGSKSCLEKFHRDNEIFVACQDECTHNTSSFDRTCSKNYKDVVNVCLSKFTDRDVKCCWYKNLMREDLARLHSLIGDDLMAHVLTDCSIFILCDLKCLVQISGQPISKTGFNHNLKKHGKVENKRLQPYSFGTLIARQWILYSQNFNCTFPAGKFFHLAGDVDKAADYLSMSIQTIRVHDFNIKYTECKLLDLKDVLRRLLVRHRKTRFKHMLNYHCKSARRKSAAWTVNDMLQKHIDYRSITRFLRAVCHNALPIELLGPKNFQVFRKKLHLFVEAGKTDSLRLGSFLEGLSLRDVAWLSGNDAMSDSFDRLRIFAQVVFWTIKYLLTILKTFFYITESNGDKYRLFYYRKHVWQSLLGRELNERIAEDSLTYVEYGLYGARMQARSHLGNAKLRFMPKSTRLRPVVHIKSSEDTVFTFCKLRNVAVVLSAIVKLCRVYCKQNHQQVHMEWQRFKKAVRNKKRIYFVKVDIKDCFGSVIQEKLMTVLESLLDKHFENCCVIRRVWKVKFRDGKMSKQLIDKAGQEINSLVEEAEMASFANCQGSVICSAKQEVKMTKSEILSYVRMYVRKMMVLVAGKAYLVRKGVIQGGFLSGILCQIYLADLERNCLVPNIGKSRKDTLMSVVDDFMFASPSKSKAENFLRLMNNGFPSYGCFVNKTKTVTNFLSDDDIPKTVVNSLNWYGLKIDTESLEVSVNYERYLELPIKYTLQFDELNSGDKIRKKLILITRSQFHKILFCPCINSQETISSNIYQLFLIMAIRLHSLVLRLPKHRRCTNVKFYVDLLESMISVVLLKLGKSEVSAGEVQWLAAAAFHARLKSYACIYGDLLEHFKSKKDQFYLCVHPTKRELWMNQYENEVPAPFSDII